MNIFVLIGFREECPFRKYMPSTSAKYGIKFCMLYNNDTFYVENIQGKEPGSASEKYQEMRVILDLLHGLRRQNTNCITCLYTTI